MDSFELTENIIYNIKRLPDDAEPEVLVKSIVAAAARDDMAFDHFIRSLINFRENGDLFNDSMNAVIDRVTAVLPEGSYLEGIEFSDNTQIFSMKRRQESAT